MLKLWITVQRCLSSPSPSTAMQTADVSISCPLAAIL